MPNAPVPVAVPRAGSWEQIYADPDGSIGARYHPRIWFKGPGGWSRMPYFEAANITIRLYVKSGDGIWYPGAYDISGGYPAEPVPIPVWIRR